MHILMPVITVISFILPSVNPAGAPEEAGLFLLTAEY